MRALRGAVKMDDMTLPAVNAVSAYRGPRGFHWFAPGLLGGAGRPGLLGPVERDLEALQRVGTGLLVSLTEEWAPDPALMAEYGIESLHLPITDRHAPDPGAARDCCDQAAEWIAAARPVVYHCRAGKGRTGTLIAAQLIHAGLPPEEAVARTRAANSTWIENDVQLQMVLGAAEALTAPAAQTALVRRLLEL
ncbi:protein-tyrosine phosphatase family protein [Rhodovulum sp. DZ06]|uniref:protein-tyrosine phosphatase family protein n=1 Tax=Rhodovulum sp. DZ06 TaxID=3425126 RepID=UPI003D342716